MRECRRRGQLTGATMAGQKYSSRTGGCCPVCKRLYTRYNPRPWTKTILGLLTEVIVCCLVLFYAYACASPVMRFLLFCRLGPSKPSPHYGSIFWRDVLLRLLGPQRQPMICETGQAHFRVDPIDYQLDAWSWQGAHFRNGSVRLQRALCSNVSTRRPSPERT